MNGSQQRQTAGAIDAPAQRSLDEQSELLYRTAELSQRFEEIVDEVDGLLDELKLNQRSWSYYREFIDGAHGMQMILHHLGCDEDCHSFDTVEQARAYLIAHGWEATPATR